MSGEKKLLLGITANGGYSADQVDGMSLGDLLCIVEDAIEIHGEDAELVLFDSGNRYGAMYGSIDYFDEAIRVVGDEDE